jgi:hypothetical protein
LRAVGWDDSYSDGNRLTNPDGNGHCDIQLDCYGYTYRYCDLHAYTYCNGHTDCDSASESYSDSDCYIYPDGNSDADLNANSECDNHATAHADTKI